MKTVFKFLTLLLLLLSLSGCMLEYDGITATPYYRDVYPRYYISPYYVNPYFYYHYTPKPYYNPKPTPRPHYGHRH